jgi:hypothetical protein
MKSKVTVALILLFYVISPCGGQERPEAAAPERRAIKTADGALFVWNQLSNNFTLAIKGKDVRPNNSTEDVFFKADGIILQIQSPAISGFINGKPGTKLTEQAILQAHRDWESEYAGSILKTKLKVQSSAEKLKNGREALYWRFDLPAGFSRVEKSRVFLTTVNGDHVIVLNGSATTDVPEDRVRQYLFDTLATLTVSPTPFDLRKLQEIIRRSGSLLSPAGSGDVFARYPPINRWAIINRPLRGRNPCESSHSPQT